MTPAYTETVGQLIDDARSVAAGLQTSIAALRLRAREIRGVDLAAETGDPVSDLGVGQLRAEAARESLAQAHARIVEARAHLALALGALR